MSRIPVRVHHNTLTMPSKLDHSNPRQASSSHPSREGAIISEHANVKNLQYNFITTPITSSSSSSSSSTTVSNSIFTSRYDDSDPAPVEIQPFQGFNVLDYASAHTIPYHILHAIPEEPFAYANLLERSGWDTHSESSARERFREMVRGAYDFHHRVRETTQLGALPRRMETIFDRHGNLCYVRFSSPPGIAVAPGADDGQFRVFRGNPQYVAPEVAQGQVHAAHQVDIWVLGVLLYVMLVGRYPFSASSDRKMLKKMVKGAYTVPDYLSIEAQDLIHRMLSADPITRASFDLVLIHPWLEPVSSIPNSPPTAHPLFVTVKKTKAQSALENIKTLFGRTPELAVLRPRSSTRTSSPQYSSPSHSTISLASADHTTAASTTTMHSNSTRPTTVSTSSISSTASTISASIKSAFKWLVDGPNAPPPKYRSGARRYSPYGDKPLRREKVDGDIESCFVGVGGERERDGDWKYRIVKEVVAKSVVGERTSQ